MPPPNAVLLCANCERWPAGGAQLTREGYPADVANVVCVACAPVYARWLANQPERLARVQTSFALDRLDGPTDDLVRWPYAALDAIHGPLAPGNVYIVAAISGGGKTTYLANCIREWDDAHVPLMVMPLEIRPEEWRVWYACVRVGVEPGDALSGLLRARASAGDPEAQHARLRIAEELERMQTRGDRLIVRSDSHVTLTGFAEALEQAADEGARIVIVDHIDHLAPDDGGGNPLDASRRVMHATLALAQRHNLILLLASQLNLDLARSPDRLAKYAPPQVQHLQFPGVKQQVATAIVGLFRPVDDDDPELLRRARGGLCEPTLALKPNRMGVAIMKHRHYGKHEGRRVELRLARGRLSDVPGMP